MEGGRLRASVLLNGAHHPRYKKYVCTCTTPEVIIYMTMISIHAFVAGASPSARDTDNLTIDPDFMTLEPRVKSCSSKIYICVFLQAGAVSVRSISCSDGPRPRRPWSPTREFSFFAALSKSRPRSAYAARALALAPRGFSTLPTLSWRRSLKVSGGLTGAIRIIIQYMPYILLVTVCDGCCVACMDVCVI